jgi:hypothetical protein
MVNHGETPEERIKQCEAQLQSEAQGLTPDQLRGKLAELKEAKSSQTSQKSMTDRATQLSRSIQDTARHYLQTHEEKHLNSFMKLVGIKTYLLELSKKISNSSAWRQDSYEKQREEDEDRKRQAEWRALDQPYPLGQPSSHYQQIDPRDPYFNNNAPGIARGAGGGNGSSRARNMVGMVQQAARPNPSSINDPRNNRNRAHSAAYDLITNPLSSPGSNNRDFIQGPDGGASGSGGVGMCAVCDNRQSMAALEHRDVGLLSLFLKLLSAFQINKEIII